MGDFLNATPTREQLAKNLERYRRRAGFESMRAVEQALGWGTKRYENYEKGRSAPPFDAIYELAQLFKVTTDDLLSPGTNQDWDVNDYDTSAMTPIEQQNFYNRIIALRASAADAPLSDILKGIEVLTKCAGRYAAREGTEGSEP